MASIEELLSGPGESDTRAALRAQEEQQLRADVAQSTYSPQLALRDRRRGSKLAGAVGGLLGEPVDPAVKRAQDNDKLRAVLGQRLTESGVDPTKDRAGFLKIVAQTALDSGRYDLALKAADAARDEDVRMLKEKEAQSARMLEIERQTVQQQNAAAAARIEQTQSAAAKASVIAEQQQLTLMERLAKLDLENAALRGDKKARGTATIPAGPGSKDALKKVRALISDTLSDVKNSDQENYLTAVATAANTKRAEAKQRGEPLDWTQAVMDANDELSQQLGASEGVEVFGFGPGGRTFTPQGSAGAAQPSAGAAGRAAAPPPSSQSAPLTVRTQAEYAAAPSGTWLRNAKTGAVFKKP